MVHNKNLTLLHQLDAVVNVCGVDCCFDDLLMGFFFPNIRDRGQMHYPAELQLQN